MKTGINVKELRGTDPEEIQRTLRKLEEDLFQHKLKRSTNQLENTMLIRRARRDIARVHTVLQQRLRQTQSAAAPAQQEK